MYYLLNRAYILFLTVAIVLIRANELPGWVTLAILLAAAACELFASAYAASKYNALEDRIKNLENKREDK